jgi:hypothetical protein
VNIGRSSWPTVSLLNFYFQYNIGDTYVKKDTSYKKKSKARLIATIVVAVVIVIGIVHILNSSSSNLTYPTSNYPTNYPTPQVYSITLFPQGQVFSINASSYEYVNFTVPQGAYSINVSGSYTSQGKVEVAILTPVQYGAFTQNSSVITSAQYYYGDTQGSTINAQLSAGSYILVFYDPGLITQDTVTIVNPIVLRYTS